MRLWKYTQSMHSFNLQYRPALLRHQQGYESCLYLQVNLCQLTVATVELTQVVLLSYLTSSYPVWLAILTVSLLTSSQTCGILSTRHRSLQAHRTGQGEKAMRTTVKVIVATATIRPLGYGIAARVLTLTKCQIQCPDSFYSHTVPLIGAEAPRFLVLVLGLI
jgi:hypothetical protein